MSNMKCGEGILIFKDGRRYVGLFMDNKMNGHGILYESTEDNIGIHGIWKNNIMYECLIDPVDIKENHLINSKLISEKDCLTGIERCEIQKLKDDIC